MIRGFAGHKVGSTPSRRTVEIIIVLCRQVARHSDLFSGLKAKQSLPETNSRVLWKSAYRRLRLQSYREAETSNGSRTPISGNRPKCALLKVECSLPNAHASLRSGARHGFVFRLHLELSRCVAIFPEPPAYRAIRERTGAGSRFHQPPGRPSFPVHFQSAAGWQQPRTLQGFGEKRRAPRFAVSVASGHP